MAFIPSYYMLCVLCVVEVVIVFANTMKRPRILFHPLILLLCHCFPEEGTFCAVQSLQKYVSMKNDFPETSAFERYAVKTSEKA